MDVKAVSDEAIVDGKKVINVKPGEPAHDLHPYLSGNFAPVQRSLPLTPCLYVGSVPRELAGGQYVRNGGNPLANSELGRDAHFFDGDGMLAGVLFRRVLEPGTGRTTAIRPEFVNQFVQTDVYISNKTSRSLRRPILPSIATLVNPLVSLVTLILTIMRSVILVLLSHLPGSQWAIRRISVANTAIIWHDGRALATCESGPPMRVMLPGLETVGWWDGKRAEGEVSTEKGAGFGGESKLLGWMKEWTTGHPRVDPITGELIAYHNTFLPPYVHYSIIPATQDRIGQVPLLDPTRILNVPVPGVSGAKMMHDFGVSLGHTVILDLPLTLNPFNLAKNEPVVSYDPTAPSRFGVFPRYRPDLTRWFETRACCVFHTANTWDTVETGAGSTKPELFVNMLACRLTSSTLVFGAGNLAAPQPAKQLPESEREEEQCRLYYWQFPFSPSSDGDSKPRWAGRRRQATDRDIRHEFALSAIPFEFPTLRSSVAMSNARYIYGCSTDGAKGFGASLGKGVKISHLAKMDVKTLVERGKAAPPERIRGCVDNRSLEEVMASTDPNDPIRCFEMPEGWYAQEASFVPRQPAKPLKGQDVIALEEDDGFLLTYVFDESQIDPFTCMPREKAASELWIIDAKNMRDVLCRIRLPQRVPYGLHGSWFSEEQIKNQRAVTSIRTIPATAADKPVCEQDEEARVQSPREEKQDPFDDANLAFSEKQPLLSGSVKVMNDEPASRKWSPAWRVWTSARSSIERRLG